MALKSGFFNSINHDRKYDVEDFSRLINALVTDGVIPTKGEEFMTVAGTGMDVIVKSGYAWFDSTWSMLEDASPVTIAPADISRPRIDAIVIDIDSRNETRKNKLIVVKGVPNTNPQKPILLNELDHHQHAIAYVSVPAGATSISAANIEIRVGKSDCPFATGKLESIDITDLFNQWEAEFDEWFANLQSQLSGDIVTNLQNQINDRVKISDKATADDLTNGTPGKWVDAASVAGLNSDSPFPPVAFAIYVQSAVYSAL